MLRPNGTALVTNTCLNSPAAAVQLEPVLDQTGVHRIIVRENGQNALMPYNLVLDRVGEPVSPAATLLDPGAILEGPDIQISPVGELDFYAFQGEAGDTITVTATDIDPTTAVPNVELRGPDGADILYCCNSGAPERSISRRLTQSGIYSVFVWEAGDDQTLDYRLTYSCSGVCPSLDLTKRYIDTASIEDVNGNGSPEEVALFQPPNVDQTRLMIRDGDTWTNIKNFTALGAAAEPLRLAAIGDSTGDLISELGILGISLNNGAIAVWTVDPVMGDASSRTYFNSAYTPLGFSEFKDLNGDGTPDVGVMAVEKATGRTRLKVRDGVTGDVLTPRTLPK